MRRRSLFGALLALLPWHKVKAGPTIIIPPKAPPLPEAWPLPEVPYTISVGRHTYAWLNESWATVVPGFLSSWREAGWRVAGGVYTTDNDGESVQIQSIAEINKINESVRENSTMSGARAC